MDKREEFLKLDNQLCFALYSASRAIIRAYKPLLDRLGITYTQYIALMVLWEKDDITLSELGQKLKLDSGTLTPLLKKMEKENLLARKRGKNDERELYIKLTPKGQEIKTKALEIPEQMFCKLPVSMEEALNLKEILTKVHSEMKI